MPSAARCPTACPWPKSPPWPPVRRRSSLSLRADQTDPATARLPGWAWALLPMLAALAWAPTLGLWFISDDFQLLRVNARQPWPQPFLLLDSALFYRPLSTSLSWNL